MSSGDNVGSESVRIGTEIKLLREQRGFSGKELADRIGLSQSQMSRLEAGKRRIDTSLLSKVAKVLTVHPSHFFRSSFPEFEQSPVQSTEAFKMAAIEPTEHVGKIIRRERRKRHMTAEELAQKIHKGKSWLLDLEGGATDLLTGTMVQKIATSLKIEAKVLYDSQRSLIKDLQLKLHRLEQAYADKTRGQLQLESGQTKAGIPHYGLLTESMKIDENGWPTNDVQDYCYLPDLAGRACFALTFVGEEMESPAAPRFLDGDLLVFSVDREVRHKDFALTMTESGQSVFRQIFFDPRGVVRLQPRNLNYAPLLLHRDEVVKSYRLLTHIQKH